MKGTMTFKELQQGDKVIIHAGTTAYMIGVSSVSNPYRKNQKMHKLWTVGFKQAQSEDKKHRLPNGKFMTYYSPIVTNPMCVRCSVPVPNTVCEHCEDEYLSTELEER